MPEILNTPMSPWERLLTLPLMELEASTVANWRLRGLPSGSLDVPECSVILTSSDDAERFDLAMLKTATTQNRDVLLMRLATGMGANQTTAVTIDVVLRSPLEPILLTNLVPCRPRRWCAVVRDREPWSVLGRRAHRAIHPVESAGVAMRTSVGP